MKKKIRVIALSVFVLLLIPFICAGSAWLYTTSQLTLAKSRGIYESPEAGMLAMIKKSYGDISQATIEYSGPNSRNGKLPHVWFVVARVKADQRTDGKPVGNNRTRYEYPGLFYLKIREGWVFVPEGAFPVLIGRMMEVFGIT